MAADHVDHSQVLKSIICSLTLLFVKITVTVKLNIEQRLKDALLDFLTAVNFCIS